MSAEPRWVFRGGGKWEYWKPRQPCPTMGKVLATIEKMDGRFCASVYVPGEVAMDADHGAFDTLEEAQRAVAAVVRKEGLA